MFSPADIERKRQIAQMLAFQGASASPRSGLKAVSNALASRIAEPKSQQVAYESVLPDYQNPAALSPNYGDIDGLSVMPPPLDTSDQRFMYENAPHIPGVGRPSQWEQPQEQFDPNLMEGIGVDPRGMFGQEDARFDDANAYQVADAGNAIIPRPATQNSLESAALGSRRGIARLTQVDAMLRENPNLLSDSQSFGGDAKRTRLEWQDYLAPGTMSEENKEYLANVSKFRMNVVNHVNLGIKEMTGAQMSNEEAKRLMKGMPNLEDSPTVFKAKLDEATYQMRLANARETYWSQKGLPGSAWEQMPLTDVEGILKQRGAEIYTGLIESGADADQARQEAAKMLAQEFGL